MSALTATEVLEFAMGAGFARAEANVMVVIAKYESGWDPANVGDQTLSRYGSRGLWQIFTGAWTPSDFGLGTSGWNSQLVAKLADPATNARAARVVFKAQGYQAWSTWNSYRGDAAWGALLAQVEKIVYPVPAPPPVVRIPAPVAHPVVNLRNKLAAAGNTDPHAVPAVQFAKAQVANGSTGWKNECAKFVRQAYGISADAWGNGTRTAAAAAHLVPGKAMHGWYVAPAGCPVYWTGGSSGAGHVALADGKGNVWSNDFGPNGCIGDGRVRLIPQGAVSAHDAALHYVGWGESYLGHKVYA